MKKENDTKGRLAGIPVKSGVVTIGALGLALVMAFLSRGRLRGLQGK